MAKKLTPITEALTRLGDAIKATNETTATLRQNGWNFPNLSSANLADLAYSLRDRLAGIDPERVSSTFDPSLVAARIDEETAILPQHFWNGNGADAYRAYTALLEWVEAIFQPVFVQKADWEKVGKDGMPSGLARKARSLASSINAVTSSVADLADKVKVIEEAHDAALSLPTDLESLIEARDAIAEISKEADKDASAISMHASQAKDLLTELQTQKEEAVRLVQRTEDAYSAATTLGLGASFETRAKSLAKSMWVWVGGLTIALAAGAVIGWLRISLVEDLLKANASATSIWLNTLLSALSIAAPVWFAWIATKQIGQRFRLAEDYAFKASVAKAYEGYRREAARLDPAFANQLFKSALERLDEAPLRFVEHESFGSPWHEALRLRGSNGKGRAEDETPSKPRKAAPMEYVEGDTELEDGEQDEDEG